MLQFNLQQFACSCDQGHENFGENEKQGGNEEEGTSPVAISSSS
jgi:hypothetical protein